MNVRKISLSAWNFEDILRFFSGHGLQDVVELCRCQLAPADSLVADFFKVEITNHEGLTGYYGPVETVIAQEIIRLCKKREFLELINSCLNNPLKRIFPKIANAHVAGVLDCILWDIQGKQQKKAVGEITAIGSPVDYVDCYASMITLDIDGPNTASISQNIKDLNFWGQKWSLPEGVEGGGDGLQRNLKRVEKLRTAIGDNGRIMLELHRRWTPEYFNEFLTSAKDFNISWLEDPFSLNELNHYLSADNKAVPICVGERFSDVLTFIPFIDRKGNFIIQTDVVWCGGYTTAGIIKQRCIEESRMMVFHGRRLIPSFHLAAFSPPEFKMLLEYNPIFEPERQTFLGIKNKLIPSENNGALEFHATKREGLWEVEK